MGSFPVISTPSLGHEHVPEVGRIHSASQRLMTSAHIHQQEALAALESLLDLARLNLKIVAHAASGAKAPVTFGEIVRAEALTP